MPTFILECGSCDHVDEYYFGMNDERVASCTHCGDVFPVDGHRLYGLEGIRISGETCPGGTNKSDYYDVGLGEYVRSPGHRRDLMEQKGLEEYSPDPEMKKHRDEARYIRKNSPVGDPDAVAAYRAEYRKAADKRRNKQVDRVFDKLKI